MPTVNEHFDGKADELRALYDSVTTMKAYLIITGTIFTLIALAHVLRTFAEWPRLGVDPWFYLEGPGLGVVAAALAFWAWRLLALGMGENRKGCQ